jgi:hypothetical protein
MAKLFGFSIDDDDNLTPSTLSPVPPNNEDGTDFYLTSGFFGSHIDIESIYRTEFDLIRRYREMALHPEVDSAIEDIVNEAIVSDTNDTPIQIELSNLNASDEIKRIIRSEFKYILELLDFDKKSHEIYRNWYVDGRLYYHKVIDIKKPQEGIQDLRYIDALKMRYVRQEKKTKESGVPAKSFGDKDVDPMDYHFPEIEEYFVYTPKTSYPVGAPLQMSSGQEKGIKFARDSIVYCTSGLVDRNKGTTLSYLNKASKTLNQLRMIEDSLVIYRILRSTERRVFYIDVGNLPKQKAEQYLRDVMMRYRSRLTYSSSDGTIKDDKKFTSIMEDYFLPRREGGRGTQVDVLQGGCLAMDTKISLLDGRELSISEIESEMKEGKQLWTYSCHPKTGEFAPGLISWAGVTQKKAKVLKITLDNGESITCTYDHKFPIYDVGFVEAKDLEVGQSMIPLYRKKEKISANSSDYEMLYDNVDKTWKFTHREVAKKCKDIYTKEFVYENFDEPKNTIHHINLNRYDNSPENLCFMGHFDHFNYHSKEINNIKNEFINSLKDTNPELYYQYKIRKSEASKKIWSSMTEEEKAEQCLKISKGIINYYNSLTEEQKIERNNNSINNLANANQILIEKLKDDDFNAWFRQQIINSWTEEKRIEASKRNKLLAEKRYSNPEYVRQYRIKHKEKQKIIFAREHFKFVKNLVVGKTTHQVKAIDVCNLINNNEDLKNLFIELNKDKSVPNYNILEGFTVNVLRKMVKDFGYKNWHHFRQETKFYNHTITKIEFLSDEIEVGTLTIDDEETIHNYHTFALSCGVYTKNSNLGELNDINYFQRKLYKDLNVPESRIGGDSGFNLGRSSEILRDEVKFSKFVGRLRKRFSLLFSDLLKTQLILKNIVTPEDWKIMNEHIQYDFLYDNHFAELKEAELLTERLNTAGIAEPYIGKYFSQDFVRRKILHQTDQEIVEEDLKIKQEIKDNVIPDPSIPIDPETGQPLPQQVPPEGEVGNNINGDMGKIPIEPKVDTSSVEPPKPKGGEI